MKTNKLTITGISLLTALGLIFFSPSAFAADNTSGIVNSGDDVEVQSSTETTTDINVDQVNEANIRQRVEATVNTGNNNASRNIGTNGGGASIDTGNAGLNVGLAVEANKNNTAISGMTQSSGGGNLTDVVNTGDDSSIDSSISKRTNINVDSENSANVTQDINAWMNTGYNRANRNIGGGGEIQTGQAGAVVGLQTDVNHNNVGIGTEDGMSASSSSSSHMNDSLITNTGDNLDTNSEVEKQTNVTMRSRNFLSVFQDIFAESNSGENTAGRNIGDGSSSFMSGNAGLNAGSSVMGNHNNSFLGSMWDSLMNWMNM